MTEITMPKMGDAMEEGTLLEWLKKEGDSVKSGEPIATIQTDKATLEMEAPGSGVLSGILVKAGETVPVGAPVAALLKQSESLPKEWGSGKSGSASAITSEPVAVSSKADHGSSTQVVEQSSPPKDGGRVKASPLAKKMASQHGLDLAALRGSGPGGRVIERDIQTALASGVKPASAPIKVTLTAQDQKVPLNRLRQIIATRTQESKQQVPHFYVTLEVDVEKILSLRQQFETENKTKVSVNDFVIKACALALLEMPEVNATFAGDSVVRYGSVNVGIAAAVDEGLLVPVIHGVQAMNLREIAASSKELVAKAREGKLHPDEMSGSTFSISNMGMLNVDNFTAIINQPNAAIVAISSAKKKPVVLDDGQIVARTRMNITGSFDHRVVDGAVGARFMNLVRGYLENPTRLLS